MKNLLILSIFVIGCSGSEVKKETEVKGTKDATSITKDATKVKVTKVKVTKDATTKPVVKAGKTKVAPVKKEAKSNK